MRYLDIVNEYRLRKLNRIEEKRRLQGVRGLNYQRMERIRDLDKDILEYSMIIEACERAAMDEELALDTMRVLGVTKSVIDGIHRDNELKIQKMGYTDTDISSVIGEQLKIDLEY